MEYYCRRKGWAIKGQKIELKVSGRKYDRQSICSLSNRTTLFEPIVYEGSANSNLICTYFSHTLPKLWTMRLGTSRKN
jgi:hypothetical protein